MGDKGISKRLRRFLSSVIETMMVSVPEAENTQ